MFTVLNYNHVHFLDQNNYIMDNNLPSLIHSCFVGQAAGFALSVLICIVQNGMLGDSFFQLVYFSSYSLYHYVFVFFCLQFMYDRVKDYVGLERCLVIQQFSRIGFLGFIYLVQYTINITKLTILYSKKKKEWPEDARQKPVAQPAKPWIRQGKMLYKYICFKLGITKETPRLVNNNFLHFAIDNLKIGCKECNRLNFQSEIQHETTSVHRIL